MQAAPAPRKTRLQAQISCAELENIPADAQCRGAATSVQRRRRTRLSWQIPQAVTSTVAAGSDILRIQHHRAGLRKWTCRSSSKWLLILASARVTITG